MVGALFVSTTVLAAGCAAQRPFVWAKDVPLSQPASEGPIQPRDLLLVYVGSQKDMSGEFLVREDGRYFQPPIGSVAAAGRKPEELARDLKAKLQGIIVNTDLITVSVPKRAPIRVHVVGEVKAPASYDLDRDRSVTAALAAAGWLNEYASADSIYVLRSRETPNRIRFRSADLTRGESHSAMFQLRDGDVVVAE